MNLPLLSIGNPALSISVLIFIVIILLYMARFPAHRAIRAMSRVFHFALRLAARSVMNAEKRVANRNREVLLVAGQEAVERLIEREFHRVNAVVSRDLGAYPSLQRELKAQLVKIDEDYRESADVAPTEPGWTKAVQEIAKIPSSGDPVIANVLSEINRTLDTHHKKAITEYREVSANRHALLKKMTPMWRAISDTLIEVDKTISGLLKRSKAIDNQMDQYEEIRNATDKAARMLSSSSMTQFFIAGFVLFIAIGGAVINFHLIALPMSEMVGGSSYIGPYKTSDVAALVIILVEVAMGLFLMESLHITRLFPVIGSMDDKMRHRMIWITFSMLLILASVEASLAYMRDQIAMDTQALRLSLTDTLAPEEIRINWIPTVGQMVMGFILPFALTFVAIPLESFVQSSRTVLGASATAFLKALAFLLRFFGNVARYMGEMFITLYDLVIFAPLWLENILLNKSKKAIAVNKRAPV